MMKVKEEKDIFTGVTKVDASNNPEINKLIILLDEVAYGFELKWGVGVLPYLVSKDMRAKFYRVLDKFNLAIRTNDYDTVKAQLDNLIKGWQTLDILATKNGYDKEPDFTVLTTDEGIDYLLVATSLDAHRLAAKRPAQASAILTYAEVAKIIQNAFRLPPTGSVRSDMFGNPRRGVFEPFQLDERPLVDDFIPF